MLAVASTRWRQHAGFEYGRALRARRRRSRRARPATRGSQRGRAGLRVSSCLLRGPTGLADGLALKEPAPPPSGFAPLPGPPLPALRGDWAVDPRTVKRSRESCAATSWASSRRDPTRRGIGATRSGLSKLPDHTPAFRVAPRAQINGCGSWCLSLSVKAHKAGASQPGDSTSCTAGPD
jgi:hypothetical protein